MNKIEAKFITPDGKVTPLKCMDMTREIDRDTMHQMKLAMEDCLITLAKLVGTYNQPLTLELYGKWSEKDKPWVWVQQGALIKNNKTGDVDNEIR